MRVTVKKQDIPKDKIVEISSSPKILMVYDGQKYYAFGGICPHAQWPLNNGEIKTFSISLGFEPLGKKIKKGDGKTPEGLYYIDKKIKDSSFYLALQISYPNPWDIRRALNLNTHPGGQIMIHGLPNKYYDKNFHNKLNDWTQGCIAVENKEIGFLWKNINVGTPVFIRK